jgi:hypothetical protein
MWRTSRVVSEPRDFLSLGAVGLGAAARSGVAFAPGRQTMMECSIRAALFLEEIGAAFVRGGGALVLDGGASVRGDGVRERVGGGVLGIDDLVGGDRSARAEPGGAVGQIGAAIRQLVRPAGEIVEGVADVLGHLSVVAAPDHRMANVMFQPYAGLDGLTRAVDPRA